MTDTNYGVRGLKTLIFFKTYSDLKIFDLEYGGYYSKCSFNPLQIQKSENNHFRATT